MDRKKAWGSAMCHLRGDESQLQVAKRAGISPSRWSEYERGIRYPRIRTREKIARGLHSTVEDMEELARRYRSGELRADREDEDPHQQVRVIELEKIQDVEWRSFWEDISVIFDRVRSLILKLIIYFSGRERPAP